MGRRDTRTATQLRAMVQARVDALPEVLEVTRRRPDMAPAVGPVELTWVDAQRRNWDLRSVTHAVGLMGPFRAIVDELRDRYALADEARG